VGDEALLIADAVDVPVVVCRDRSMAVRALVADGVDIVISDDGLQHYALDRDFEIVAMDSARGFGNGHRLPVGPLRESPSRLATVDWVLQREGAEAFSHCPLRAVAVEHLASGDRHDLDSATIPRRVNAVAGIGNPDAFFDTLRDLGFVLESQRAFPDHHPFTAADVAALGDAPLIMTAKDAVKCRAFAGDNHWCLHVEAALPAGLVEAIEDRAAARSQEA
jgi:tetraacyldisaccharide 4'-kinase